MESPVDKIKQKLDIVDFIGQYVTLKKSGRNYKACCPFHQEKSPSFVISPERQIWHCFGSCGTGGDVIGFWMKRENLSFREALQDLARLTGVELDQADYSDDEHKKKEAMLSVNELAAKYYKYVLRSTPQGEAALSYLKDRGIREQIIATFEIGYAPDSWDSFFKFATKKSYQPGFLVEAGLAIRAESSNRIYDRFRNRIIFPIRDIRGSVIGFSGRVLTSDQKGAKYVNTPETLIYHKRSSLYGIHLTKDVIRKADNVYVVEGEFDLISPYQNGISNIVAIKGSALTEEQLSILKRFTNRITLALDADQAGIEAMKRGIREAEKKDFEILAVQFREGKDPDDAVRADVVKFKEDLENALPLYDFLLRHFQQKYPNPSPFQKKKIADEFGPFLIHINNPIVRSHYEKKIAQFLDVEVKSVEKLLRSIAMREKNSYYRHASVADKKKEMRVELEQKYILSLLLQGDRLSQPRILMQELEPDDFTLPPHRLTFAALQEYFVRYSQMEYVRFVASLKPELRALVDQLFLYASSVPEMSDGNLAQLVYDIKLYACKFQIALLTKSDIQDEEKMKVYNTILQELPKKKNEIEKRLQTM